MKRLRIMSGGAAQGLVRKLQPEFESEHACRIEGTFGAVGLMRDQFLAGEPCDLLILTEALIADLGSQGHVQAKTACALGHVKTGVALKSGSASADVSSPDKLKALLAAACGIYFPDPAKATAGIHFMKVLQSLGLHESKADAFRTFPNGATAMAALAQATETDPVGCTQVTEILFARGVELTGLLPAPHELSTVYTAAVCTRAEEPALAAALIGLLTNAQSAAWRKQAGFDET